MKKMGTVSHAVDRFSHDSSAMTLRTIMVQIEALVVEVMVEMVVMVCQSDGNQNMVHPFSHFIYFIDIHVI